MRSACSGGCPILYLTVDAIIMLAQAVSDLYLIMFSVTSLEPMQALFRGGKGMVRAGFEANQ